MSAGNTWYTVRWQNETACVVKFDQFLFVEEVYYIYLYGRNKRVCTCPAGNKPTGCRHKDMWDMATSQHQVNLGWFYNYDTEEWQVPFDNERAG